MHEWLILHISMTSHRNRMAGLPPDLEMFGNFVFYFPTHELVTTKCLHTISSRINLRLSARPLHHLS